jgi:hypothetical protein
VGRGDTAGRGNYTAGKGNYTAGKGNYTAKLAGRPPPTCARAMMPVRVTTLDGKVAPGMTG